MFLFLHFVLFKKSVLPLKLSDIQNLINILLFNVAYFRWSFRLQQIVAAILTACKKLVVKCSFLELAKF